MSATPCGLGVSGSDISFNTRVKSYPDGRRAVLVCDKPIFKAPGWEAAGWRAAGPAHEVQQDHEPSPANLERFRRRAVVQLRDLALCTPFRYFVTLTLDKSRVDRYDAAAIVKRLKSWLDNNVRRKGLAYVLVPERHQDGAIHFHGFFNDALPVVDSGAMVPPGGGKPRRPRSAAQRREWAEMGGHVVYNLPGWGLGFSTAMELYGEYPRAVAYVCKYIGKQEEKIGGRWYYSGGPLGRPEVSYCDSSIRDLEQAEGAYSFAVRPAGLSFVGITLEGGDRDGPV